MAESFSAQGLLSDWAIGGAASLVDPLLHIYGHIRAVRKQADKPEDIDTQAEFDSVANEVLHAFADGAEITPMEWDDQAVAKLTSLAKSEAGSEFLFTGYRWWFGIPAPQKPEVEQKMGEIAKQIVDPA